MPPQLADGLSILEKPNNEGIDVPPGKRGYTYWEMVEKIILNWQEIKLLSKRNKPPFAFRITARKIERIS